jgi:ParB-like chromosome segregation protein Spo0J
VEAEAVKVLNESIEDVALSDLQPHPRNPRRGNVEAIKELIAANGWYGAVIAQRSTGYILAGNHRYLAAREVGAESLPTIYLDVDDATALRILLSDNRANDLASYDNDALSNILEEIRAAEGSLDGTGYTDEALEALIKETALGAPQEFKEVDESLETEHTCPRCGYRWSGGE